MKQYKEALQEILENGQDIMDRTGVGTRSIFGMQMKYDLSKGFPAVTTKKLAWKSVVSELLWFLEGSTDERRLAEILYDKPREELIDKTTIWTANANKQGVELGYENTDLVKELGPVYGKQWRDFNGVDQIEKLIHDLKYNQNSRQIILNAWNASEVHKMALPPCHALVQFRVINNKLSTSLYQRSADFFLGVPFNIASYALLTHMLCKITGLEVGEFVHSIGDAHIYLNHIDAVNEQLQREPLELPELELPDFFELQDILNSKVYDYQLIGYNHHSAITAPMAV